MKIGLSRPFADPGHPLPDVDMGGIARIMEDAGFEWLSYGHHTVRPMGEPVLGPHKAGVPLYQDPLIGAARATAMTERLEVSTGVLIMPMQHPVNVAKQAACIDLYSNGRFLLGLGTGGASRLEIETSGGSFERRWAYTVEAIQVMKGLWTKDAFSFSGEFFTFGPVTMGPRTQLRPHPPVLLGGYSDTVLRHVGTCAEGWLPAYAGTKLLTLSDKGMTGPQHLREGREKLHRHAEEAGRDMTRFEIGVILAPGFDDPDLLKIYEDAGADRIAVSLPHIASMDEARCAVEGLAQRLL